MTDTTQIFMLVLAIMLPWVWMLSAAFLGYRWIARPPRSSIVYDRWEIVGPITFAAWSGLLLLAYRPG